MADNIRNERLTEYLKEEVSAYIARETNRTSLITVTRVILDKSLKIGQVLFTVYPEDKEEEVHNFLKRNAKEIRAYLRKNIRTRAIPFLSFEIDKGEKNRQNVDELLQ